MGGKYDGFSASDYSHLEGIAKRTLMQSQEGNRHVFISFDHEDLTTINLLRGQAKNDKIPIDFDDYSVKKPFNSENADYIKRQIKERIEKCSVTLVYLSDKSAKSNWVNWEIEESIRQGKGVIGIYSGDTPPKILPTGIVNNKCKLVKWSVDSLPSAIEEASINRNIE